ncbi:YARHG domain-containing protein [Segatella bryantii]|uniref:YARHG domain-containing protein n=1 Tax=Segatella bryantii TaxID=77095 RepID=UPI001EDB638B|nr:YARHG domain-containing protein [Segatella bryantii]UKK72223.1 YARHG domain-containing protein [Segatella bryantii]
MDLSQLNVCELRVVRNAFAARQGYCFKDATLRGVFSSTTWYNDTMMGRFFREDGGQKLPYHYSKAEMDFINRAKQREEELLKKKFCRV